MNPHSQAVSGPHVRTIRRAKPKPVSLQRHFVLMQAGTVALALWLVSSSLFLSLEIQRRLSVSLRQLDTTLALAAEIQLSDNDLILTFWQAYYSRESELQQKFELDSRRVQELTQQYARLQLSASEQSDVDVLIEQEVQLVQHTTRLLDGNRNAKKDASQLHNVQELDRLTTSTLTQMTHSELGRLNASAAELNRYTQALYALLIGCGLFAVVVLVSFRYAHRRHLWQPLDQLQEMVLAIQRGNLNVSGLIPPSVEFGRLFQTFLQMAKELREMRDSLERRVAERSAKLETAQKELLQAAKLASLGQLVSGVAHEINNPLTSILGFSEILLARSELASSLRPQVRAIKDEALRLKNVVANLSSFARRAPQLLKQIDLRTVLDRLLELRHYQLQASNIQVSYGRPARPVWVKADPDQLLQVLLNLVLNAEQAVMAHRARGNLWLACGQEDGTAWLSVRDDGGGMTPEVREHLFEPFFTTKPVGQGTGLGLSISHGIIRQHEGTLAIQSEIGQGTTVRITLPVMTEILGATASQPEPVGNQAEAGNWPSRALVVDDEPTILEMVKQALLEHGCHITCLQNSTAVEAAIRNGDFDFIVCDLRMPALDGLQILRLLRKLSPRLARRFLLMTGNLAEVERHDIELAAVPVLQKPFAVSQLLEAVQGVARKPN